MKVASFNPLTPIVKAADWVRADYPRSAPPHGHMALIALNGREHATQR
jgi:hypothetical protein